jgi:hypothetical protein
MSDVQTLSPGEMSLGRQAMYPDAVRGLVDRVFAANDNLVTSSARALGWNSEQMADWLVLLRVLPPDDPRVGVMASPLARKAVGLKVGLADGAERRLVERIKDPSETARQAADLLFQAERHLVERFRGPSEAGREAAGMQAEVNGQTLDVDVKTLRGCRLTLLNLAKTGGDRAAAGLGEIAPVLERVGLGLAKIVPELAADVFGMACACIEAERSARERARSAVRGDEGR